LNFNGAFHPEISESAAAISRASCRLSPGILQSVFASFHRCDISARVRPRLWRLRFLCQGHSDSPWHSCDSALESQVPAPSLKAWENSPFRLSHPLGCSAKRNWAKQLKSQR